MHENPSDHLKPNQEQLALRVEVATPRDWQAYKKIRLHAIRTDAEMLGISMRDARGEVMRGDEEWKRILARPDYHLVVLSWNGNEPVGMGVAVNNGIFYYPNDKNTWELGSDYVRKEFRGQNLQRKMIAFRLKEIINQGGTKVLFHVLANNRWSIPNAEHFGFSKMKERLGDKDYFMQLDLTDPLLKEKINAVLDAG